MNLDFIGIESVSLNKGGELNFSLTRNKQPLNLTATRYLIKIWEIIVSLFALNSTAIFLTTKKNHISINKVYKYASIFVSFRFYCDVEIGIEAIKIDSS